MTNGTIDLGFRSIGAAVACCCAVSALAKGQAPVRVLHAPEMLSKSFDRISGVHELGDGRVVVVDADEQGVWIADFLADTAVRIGRGGSGPGEYRFPVRLLSLGGDSVGVDDGGNRRILVITASGKVGGILSTLGTRIAERALARGEAPRAGDGLGRLYALGFSPFTPQALQPSDSAPIERWRVGSIVRDTVAYLPLPPMKERVLPPGEGSRAFATEPQWAVGNQGQIAILRVKPYSVDLVDSKGARVKGKPFRYEPIRVSDAQKLQWREEQSQPRSVLIMKPNGAPPAAGLRRTPIFEPVQWPVVLPPFLDNAAHFAPDGTLWIQRTTKAGDPPVYDLIDPRALVTERVRAPAHTRLVGFGQSSAYLVRTDEDGQEVLERYPNPSTGKGSVAASRPANGQRLVLPDLQIESEGAGYSFGRISGVVVDRHGRFLLASQDDGRLLIFDRAGQYISSLGRSGAGPGEIRVFGMVGLRGDSVWVSDPAQSRITVLPIDGGSPRTLVIPWAGEAVLLSDGSVGLTPRDAFGRPVNARSSIGMVRVAPGGKRLGPVFDMTFVPRRLQFLRRGQLVVGMQPFDDAPMYAVSPNGRWVVILRREPTLQGGPVVQLVESTGRPVWTKALKWRPPTLDPRMVRRTVADLAGPSADPATVMQVTKALFVPKSVPSASGVRVGLDGSVWVRGPEVGDTAISWTRVLDGAAGRSLWIPKDFWPYWVENSLLIGTETDSLGATVVRRYRVPD